MLLVPPRRMNLEQAIAYIEDDELDEVTQGAVRLAAVPGSARAEAERATCRGCGGVSVSPVEMLEQHHRARQFASLLLQQVLATHGIHCDGRQHSRNRAGALASNGSTQPPVRRARSRNTSASRAFQSATSCSTISLILLPHRVCELAAARPATLEHVADIGDHARAGARQRARQDRQQPRHQAMPGIRPRSRSVRVSVDAVKACSVDRMTAGATSVQPAAPWRHR